MKLYRLVYFSSSPKPLSADALRDILQKARQSNEKTGITGMLLYKDGNFIQLLEGDEASVRETFKRIEADPRHRNIVVVFEEAVDQRIFSGWSMGCREVDDTSLRNVPGYNATVSGRDGLAQFRDDPSGCLYLLKMFGEG